MYPGLWYRERLSSIKSYCNIQHKQHTINDMGVTQLVGHSSCYLVGCLQLVDQQNKEKIDYLVDKTAMKYAVRNVILVI